MQNKSSLSSASLFVAMIVAGLIGLIALLLVGVPSELKADVASSERQLKEVEQSLAARQQQVAASIASDPQLFQGPAFDPAWQERLKDANAKLKQADAAAVKLDRLVRANKHSSVPEIKSVLAEERHLRSQAVDESGSIFSAYDQRENFKREFAADMQSTAASAATLASADYSALTKKVEQAENDWPAKREDLSTRLAALVSRQKKAAEWQSAAKQLAGKPADALTAADYTAGAALKEEMDGGDGADPAKALLNQTNQLYTEWDKILEDLDRGSNEYRDRIEQVVTTVPAPGATGTVETSEAWHPISEPEWQRLEHDIGMTLAHKDFGKYDSEANTVPEPPGFAYMATPEQGRNQYGYWEHRDGGSFWTWLPEYLILRDVLWHHSYQPVPSVDWSRYQQAQRSGTTYYGRDAAGVPKYGSSGTFTRRSYADSRYVQHGGFAGSKYAAHNASGEARPSFAGKANEDHSAFGKRFGKSFQSSPGQRFGRIARSAGRSFGHRR